VDLEGAAVAGAAAVAAAAPAAGAAVPAPPEAEVLAPADAEVRAAAEADLLMPPWPLQAPRPPREVVPSLQITSPPRLEVPLPEDALVSAGAAAAGAAVPADADLLTPPCPLQAPRPAREVVPSLQITVPGLAEEPLEEAAAGAAELCDPLAEADLFTPP